MSHSDILREPLVMSNDEEDLEFIDEMRSTARLLMSVELVLQPIMYFVGRVNLKGALGVVPYVVQVGTIVASFFLQYSTLKRTLNRAPLTGVWRRAADALINEKDRIASVETCVPRFIAVVVMNYSLFWAGMAASLVAGQSYHLWTPCDGRVWTEAWSDVPFVGHVTGPLSRVLDVPVVLTLFSVLNYVILIVAFRVTTEDTTISVDLLWKSKVDVMDVMDLGNIPLFSALCEQVFWREQPVVGTLKSHCYRHLRLSVVGSAHVWVKTSLLAMTFSRATHLETFNIVVPLLLTMGSKAYSTLQVETAAINLASESSTEYSSCCDLFKFFFIWAILLAVFAIPGLVVLACTTRLAGIVFCPCHYLNLISGCVPCVC